MAAKGAILKKEIMRKIMEIFPESFLYNNDKEIRINGTEEGNSVQIKITLTCAKSPVNIGGLTPQSESNAINFETEPTAIKEPTEEEKARLKFLLEELEKD